MSRASIRVLSVLLLGILCPGGCGYGTGDVCVSYADSGKEIEVWTGQTVVVRLPCNPTTGYLWEAVSIDKSILRQVGEPELEPQADTAVGAPMTATFRFEVMKNGLTELRMANRRSWQKFKEPADTFVLKLIAH